MSVNKHRPHLFILPEDRANSQLANGFWLEAGSIRGMLVLPEAGGWKEVLGRFKSDHLAGMSKYPDRLMILLIDFDGRDDRLNEAKHAIPDSLRERVFILGVWTEPEDLKADLGSYETIGRAIARDCRDGTITTWEHKLLLHNEIELNRLRDPVCRILFPPAEEGGDL